MSTHAPLPDDELVRLAANGDRAAFAVLYHRHVAAVHRQLAGAAPDAPALTALIVQVFSDAMRHLDELGQRSSEDVGATLAAIARRRAAGRRGGGHVAALTVGTVDRAWRELDRRWPDGNPPADPPTWWPAIAAGATAGVLVLAIMFALTPEPNVPGGPSAELAAEPLLAASEDGDEGLVLPRPRETVDLSTIAPTPAITPSPAPLESETEDEPEPTPTPTTPSPTPTPEPTPSPTEDVDEAPVVAISSPSDGSTLVTEGEDEGGAYATVTLAGSATDDRDAADALTYSWTSDLEGALLTGTSGTARLHVPEGQLTASHAITLTVTDSAGNVGSDTVRVIVTRAP